MQNVEIKKPDGFILHGIYNKVENEKAIVQIMHGMCEHKERYIPLINVLNDAGYSCIVTDTRGHGQSVDSKYVLGYTGPIELLVEDQAFITSYLENNNHKNIIVFSHSFGTIISRNYIMENDARISKLILSGTVCPNDGAIIPIFISKLCKKNNSNKLLYFFSNGFTFNPDLSWLSYNKQNVENFEKDPLCGFKFKNSGYNAVFSGCLNLTKKKKYKCQNSDLKILSLSGKDDRTTGHKKGLNNTKKALNKAGYNNITIKEYDNMKHEILFEDDAKLVYADILSFLEE